MSETASQSPFDRFTALRSPGDGHSPTIRPDSRTSHTRVARHLSASTGPEAPVPAIDFTNARLPPGPISNPGYDSLVAALHPSVCRDLYFVAKGDGTHAFCPDLVCHNRNVEKYQIAPAQHR